ncbi:ABC transporter permease [Clostridium felsineum]|uniref:ABC transporter permease n=1 Tax=Clostridium felsineum TaxID=36839 RepID=UPI00098C0D1C|nr:ABC transporter permease [Clostridium felsineum]URZ03629.1 hypothetical protein CLAUR_036900 [Clostridium felsineum]
MKACKRTIKALISKELKDYDKNPIIIIALFLPFLTSIFYGNIFKEVLFKIDLCINSGITFLGIILMPYLIIEEKEKHTLDVLILYSVNSFEFLMGKVLPFIFFALFANILSVLNIFKLNFITFIEIILIIFISLLSVTLIGALIGFVCRNQSEAMFVSIIIMLLIYIVTLGGSLNSVLSRISSLCGISAMNLLLGNIIEGKGIFSSPQSLIIMIIWIILPIILFRVIYKRKKFE